MSRRDTIIIAVLINAGLLTILFATAMNSDEEERYDHRDLLDPPVKEHVAQRAEPTKAGRDEVDLALQEFKLVQTEAPAEKPEQLKETSVASKSPGSSLAAGQTAEGKSESKTSPGTEPGYLKVTVRRGDYLERIARANHTTVKAIMDANGMASTRLQVGQVLRVPVKANESKASVSENAAASRQQTKQSNVSGESFYTVVSGDNPWLISKRTGVSFEEILRLNGLDEYKARQLKPGDRLRIR